MQTKRSPLLAGEGSTGAGGTGGTDDAGKGTTEPVKTETTTTTPPAGAGDEKKTTTTTTEPKKGSEGEPKKGSFLEGATHEGTEKKEDDGKDSAVLELKVPEGLTVEKDTLDAYQKFAKEKGWNAEQAQATLDFYASTAKAQAERQASEAEQKAKEQRAALEAHPVIGGAKLAEAQELARRGIATLDRLADGLGTKAAKVLMDSGLQDNPEIAHLLYLVGQSMSEDSLGKKTAPTATPTPEDRAKKRYANSLAAGKSAT